MDWNAHRMFGYVISDRFDLPYRGFIEWTILPDMRYYQDRYFKYLLFHRWTLHGPENIETVIDQGKESRYVEYYEAYDLYIRCLIMSHTYLDLFNYVIHPSYPGNTRFKYIKEQIPLILRFRTLKAPKGLKEVLMEMASLHQNPHDLLHTMLLEYYALPEKKYWIRQILKLYRR